MYASKRSVAKAQGTNTENVKNYHINKIRHRGMQKDHIQITPDGKVIQHYKMDSRSAAFMKSLKAAQAKAVEGEVTDDVDETRAEATEE